VLVLLLLPQITCTQATFGATVGSVAQFLLGSLIALHVDSGYFLIFSSDWISLSLYIFAFTFVVVYLKVPGVIAKVCDWVSTLGEPAAVESTCVLLQMAILSNAFLLLVTYVVPGLNRAALVKDAVLSAFVGCFACVLVSVVPWIDSATMQVLMG
jgi:hypothetical protein